MVKTLYEPTKSLIEEGSIESRTTSDEALTIITNIIKIDIIPESMWRLSRWYYRLWRRNQSSGGKRLAKKGEILELNNNWAKWSMNRSEKF